MKVWLYLLAFDIGNLTAALWCAPFTGLATLGFKLLSSTLSLSSTVAFLEWDEVFLEEPDCLSYRLGDFRLLTSNDAVLILLRGDKCFDENTKLSLKPFLLELFSGDGEDEKE